MAIEIVDFPNNSMVIFHSKMLVHQRVNQWFFSPEIEDMGLSENVGHIPNEIAI